jgi:starch-binding outer membrane protein, SusD/RagB family
MKQLIILISLFALLLTGCNSFLDEKPQQSIDASTALTTGENVRLALTSSYVNIRNAYGQQLLISSELMADNGEIFFQGTFLEPLETIGKSLVASSVWPQDAWQDLYKGIYICNQVLSHMDVVAEADRPQIKGEALFLRGLSYFDLARFYAPAYQPGGANNSDAVPLLVETDNVMYPSRSTVAQVYDRAQADLEEAATLLSPDEPFFANKYAALAILSRLYMAKEMWAKAADAANEIIGSGKFLLSATPFDAFNHKADTPEDVFTFKANNEENLGSQDGTGNAGMSAFYASTNITGRSDFAINNKVFEMYEPDDLRGKLQSGLDKNSVAGDIKSMYYYGFGADNSGGIFCSKWLDYAQNMTFVRLAEMYLTRAEANYNNGTEIGDSPLNDIKAIRDRAGVTTPNTIDIDFIRHERVRELIFEGQRLHDYKRWKWPVEDLAYDSPRLVFPIPQRERDVNVNLSQNTGY